MISFGFYFFSNYWLHKLSFAPLSHNHIHCGKLWIYKKTKKKLLKFLFAIRLFCAKNIFFILVRPINDEATNTFHVNRNLLNAIVWTTILCAIICDIFSGFQWCVLTCRGWWMPACLPAFLPACRWGARSHTDYFPDMLRLCVLMSIDYAKQRYLYTWYFDNGSHSKPARGDDSADKKCRARTHTNLNADCVRWEL